MTEDEWRDKQLNEYLNEYDDQLSNCCDAMIYPDTDICSACKDNCVTHAQYQEQLRDGRGDAQYEEARDER